jgi:hypothetical protein
MPGRAGGWLLAGTLLLGSCGGEPGDPPATETSETAPDAGSAAPSALGAAPDADACELLGAADVGAVLGQPVTDSLALALPEGGPIILSQCNYATAQNPAIVSFLLRRGNETQTARQVSDQVRQTLDESGIPLEDVAGLGDVAFFGSNQLHVFGDAGWYVIVTPVPSAGLEQARALAQPAVERLESGA